MSHAHGLNKDGNIAKMLPALILEAIKLNKNKCSVQKVAVEGVSAWSRDAPGVNKASFWPHKDLNLVSVNKYLPIQRSYLNNEAKLLPPKLHICIFFLATKLPIRISVKSQPLLLLKLRDV